MSFGKALHILSGTAIALATPTYVRDAILCAPSKFELFHKIQFEKLSAWTFYKVETSDFCREDRAFIIDKDGNITTVRIKNGKIK